MKPHFFAAFSASIAFFSASTVFAASPAELVKQGVALREKGDDQAALEKFREADSAAPSGETKAQMALAEQALGRWVDAEAHLKSALDDTANPFVKRNKKALDGALETIAKHTTTIVLDLPAETLVAVDDKDFAAAQPFYKLSSGVHRFRLRKTGFSDTPKDIDCGGGAQCRESVTLLPAVILENGKGVGVGVPGDPKNGNNKGSNGLGTEQPAAKGSWMKPVGITLGVVGLVGVGVGIYSHAQFESNAGDANDANGTQGCRVNSECAKAVNKAKDWVAPRAIGYAAGGAFVAAGLVLFVLAPKKTESVTPKGATLQCAPGFASFGCAGTF